MPYDSQGHFTRVHSWTSDYENGIEIVCDRHDEEDDNFASGLNMALCRDGRSVMTGNLKLGSNKITGLANGETTNDAVNKGQLNALQNSLEEEIAAIEVVSYVGDLKQSLLTANHGNWILCDGQAISRTDYADLFDLIGTTYGSGDGVTTFNVPDYSNIIHPTSSAVGIKGNGKALGLTNGTKDGAMINIAGSYGALSPSINTLNTDVGTNTQSHNTEYQTWGSVAIGIVEDETKSGIVGEISSSVQMNWFIKAK